MDLITNTTGLHLCYYRLKITIVWCICKFLNQCYVSDDVKSLVEFCNFFIYTDALDIRWQCLTYNQP